MTEVENTYGLITADDMDTIELKEIKTTDAGSAAANF